VVEGTDFAYTVPTGYRTAPADALTALRSLATAFFQAAEPRSPIVPFGRGHAKGVGKQLDVVVIFGAPVSGRDDHGDVALASINPDAVAGAWAGGYGKQGLQFAPDPIEIRQDGTTWVLASASYARPDGSQRRVRVGLGRRGRNGLLLAVDAAANQETAVAALWEQLVATARVGRDTPETTWLEKHPALLPGMAALLGILVLIVNKAAIPGRSAGCSRAWDGPRSSAHGMDLRALSMDQLRGGGGGAAEPAEPPRRKRKKLRAEEEVPDPLAALMGSREPAPEAPVPEAPFAATAWAATPATEATPAWSPSAMDVEHPDAGSSLDEQLDPEMAELARRMDEAREHAGGPAFPPVPAADEAYPEPVSTPEPDEGIEVLEVPAPERPRERDEAAAPPTTPPRRVLATPSQNGTPAAPRILRNDAYLEE